MHDATRKVNPSTLAAARDAALRATDEDETGNRFYGGGQIVSLKALREGKGIPRRIDFNSGAYVIGRGEEVDCQIIDGTVSRVHAKLEIHYAPGAEPEVTISDLGSSNGTHINRVTIERARLKSGDILEIGTVPFRVRTAKDLKLTLPISLSNRKPVERPEMEQPSTQSGPSPKRNSSVATVLRKPTGPLAAEPDVG